MVPECVARVEVAVMVAATAAAEMTVAVVAVVARGVDLVRDLKETAVAVGLAAAWMVKAAVVVTVLCCSSGDGVGQSSCSVVLG